MAYVFLDLPADSADLETFKGYHISRVATIAQGGPVRVDRWAPAEELLLESTRRPWFEPALMRAPELRGLARKVSSRAWCMKGFMTRTQAAALLSVPAVCFAMVWAIGHAW